MSTQTLQVGFLAYILAVLVGLFYIFLMTNPSVMTLLLVVGGIVAGRQVLVVSRTHYKLMRLLTED